MASSSNDKICIRCGKKNDPLNHVGARYQDNQNEKHPLQTILEQAQALKLDNLASIIEGNLQNKTPTFIHLSCRHYLRNNFRPRKRSMGGAQQSIDKRVARRSDPVMFDFKSQCFYCEKPCIEDKKHADRKNFEIVSTISTKIYTSTLEIFAEVEKTIMPKTLKGDYLELAILLLQKQGIIQHVDPVLKTHFPKNHQRVVQYRQIK